jgi:hypothetical protein
MPVRAIQEFISVLFAKKDEGLEKTLIRVGWFCVIGKVLCQFSELRMQRTMSDPGVSWVAVLTLASRGTNWSEG